MQAHSAPLGMTFLTNATQFPTDVQGDALVAFHGSWNRSTPTGTKSCTFISKTTYQHAAEDFVTGWQLSNGSRWGRPVDVLVYKDGSILISDDVTGHIIRVAKNVVNTTKHS